MLDPDPLYVEGYGILPIARPATHAYRDLGGRRALVGIGVVVTLLVIIRWIDACRPNL